MWHNGFDVFEAYDVQCERRTRSGTRSLEVQPMWLALAFQEQRPRKPRSREPYATPAFSGLAYLPLVLPRPLSCVELRKFGRPKRLGRAAGVAGHRAKVGIAALRLRSTFPRLLRSAHRAQDSVRAR